MPRDFLRTLSPKQLLQLTGEVIDELTSRDICRTGNNPLSDYTEWLVTKRYGWIRAPNSEQGYDAKDRKTGWRYEIKGRRVTAKNPSRQLSAIRDLEGKHFGFLIAVIYNKNFEIIKALKVPHSVVVGTARRSKHTNSWILHANNALADMPSVEDITQNFVGFDPQT
jgi:hypothetical protein